MWPPTEISPVQADIQPIDLHFIRINKRQKRIFFAGLSRTNRNPFGIGLESAQNVISASSVEIARSRHTSAEISRFNSPLLCKLFSICLI